MTHLARALAAAVTDPWQTRLNALAENGNAGRWALAQFAWESKAEGVPGWADRIAAHPLIRRKAWTVRHWTRAHEIGQKFPALRDRLPFSAWAVLAKWEGGTPAAELQAAIDEFLADPTLTVEDLAQRLQERFGDDTPERDPYPVTTLGQAARAHDPATPVVILGGGWLDVDKVRVTAARNGKGNGK